MKPELLTKIENQFNLVRVDNEINTDEHLTLFKDSNDEDYYIIDFTGLNAKNINITEDLSDGNVILVFDNEEQANNICNKLDFNSVSTNIIYDNIDDTVTIQYELPEYNYLEYDKKSTCRVYNINLKEMLKLSSSIGKTIFNYNVRYYLGKFKTKPLNKNFKSYLYNYIKKKNESFLENESIKSFFVDVTDNEFEYTTDIFWLCHNGITMCTDSYDINYNKMTFKTASSYILNGCQSISSFSDIIMSFTDKIKRESDKDELMSILDEFEDEIIFKVTILIESEPKKIRYYSFGLNTQNPISVEDILASSERTIKFNSEMENVRIIRPGEKYDGIQLQIDALRFLKMYLVCVGNPGKAKNYNKTDIYDEFIKSISTILKGDVKLWEKRLLLCDRAKKQFDIFKNDGFNTILEGKTKDEQFYIDNNDMIKRYGVNYFQAYCVKNEVDQIDRTTYDSFINDIMNYCEKSNKKLDFSDFKSDALYKAFKKED